jgi:hypothetical protein
MYDMVYCWIVRFNKDGKIDPVRAYLDTDLLTRAIEENGRNFASGHCCLFGNLRPYALFARARLVWTTSLSTCRIRSPYSA